MIETFITLLSLQKIYIQLLSFMQFDKDVLQKKIENTFLEFLEIEFLSDDNTKSFVGRMFLKKEFAQTMHILHGGITVALAESIAGVGSNLLCDENERCVGTQISATHISSGQLGDTVLGKGLLLHKGRRSHVWRVDIVSETTNRLISTINVTNMVIPK